MSEYIYIHFSATKLYDIKTHYLITFSVYLIKYCKTFLKFISSTQDDREAAGQSYAAVRTKSELLATDTSSIDRLMGEYIWLDIVNLIEVIKKLNFYRSETKKALLLNASRLISST